MLLAGATFTSGTMENFTFDFEEFGMSDIQIENHGTIVLIRALTAVGKAWVEEHVEAEAWQYLGEAIAAEPRAVPLVINGMLADGLEVACC